MKFLNLTTSAMIVFAVACEDETFRGQKGGIVPAAEQVYQTTCNPTQNISTGQNSVEGLLAPQIRVSGDFCSVELTPITKKRKQLVFVNDISGSMKPNDNDKSTSSVCSRAETIQKVLQKIKPQTTSNAIVPDIDVLLLNFSSTAGPADNTLSGFQSIDTVLLALDNPAGTLVSSLCKTEGGTNYEAAFDLSKTSILADKAGTDTPMVFFISDGEPSISNSSSSVSASGTKAKDDGERAATDLKSSTGADLFIFYLNSSTSFQPTYLEKLTSKDKIAVASDASLLAQQAESIIPPEPVDLSTDQQHKGNLTAPGFPGKQIPVRVFEKISGSKQWSYETESFQPYGRSNQTVQNTLNVQIPAQNGKSANAQITINFKLNQ